MNDVQITALAHKYVEEGVDPRGFSKSTYEELVEEKAENVAYVLRWLSHRYCLVEKESIRKEYDSVKDTPDECNYEKLGATWDEWPYLSRFYDEGYKLGQKDVLESLFPEITKRGGND